MKWRVGTKVGRNVYRDNVLYMSFPAGGEGWAISFVEMMNAKEPRKPEPRKVRVYEGSSALHRELILNDALVEKLCWAILNSTDLDGLQKAEHPNITLRPGVRAILDHLFGEAK